MGDWVYITSRITHVRNPTVRDRIGQVERFTPERIQIWTLNNGHPTRIARNVRPLTAAERRKHLVGLSQARLSLGGL